MFKKKYLLSIYYSLNVGLAFCVIPSAVSILQSDEMWSDRLSSKTDLKFTQKRFCNGHLRCRTSMTCGLN